MKKTIRVMPIFLLFVALSFSPSPAQDKKLEKIRTGGGAVGAPPMTMWLAQ
jgi:hypothetical protein